MKKVMSKYGDGGRIKRRSTTVKVVNDTPDKISAVSTTTVNRKSGAPKKIVSKSYENNFDAKGQVIGGSDVLKIEKSKYDKSGKLKSTVTKGASTFQKGGSTGTGVYGGGIMSKLKNKGQAIRKAGQDLKSAVFKKMATGGMVNTNSKIKNDVSPSTKGVVIKVNPKVAANKTAKKYVGGITKAPKSAVPKAKFGGGMKKGSC